MRRAIPLLMLAVLSVVPSGCATFAKKPDTPADRQTAEELERDPAPCNERCYLLVFGAQTDPRQAKYTHSWATVVKVVDQGSGQPPYIEAHTISWMPATLDIDPMSFRVECGTDLDLCTTIHDVLRHDERISLWGPYQLRTGLYRKFRIQKDFVDSGAIGYQCIDTVGEAARNGNGSNCIHAITDLDSHFDRGGYPLWRFGEQASEYIVNQIVARDGFIDPCTKHEWLLGPLGIADCPIVKRDWDQRKVNIIRRRIKFREFWWPKAR
jgi:hypothetical protein